MSDSILDASALLVWLHREPGEQRVAGALAEGATISSVNLSEVVAKLADAGGTDQLIREALLPLGLNVASFDADEAFSAGLLRPPTRAGGLSFGDRACLALGIRTGDTILTADRSWADLDLEPQVRVSTIR